jgi:GH15 family glucan-1,4-alpha-glucosidase
LTGLLGATNPGGRTVRNGQPSIGDYAYISDCHSCALISRSGSIDWCCMPRIDAGSCFGRILDWDRGGYCQVAPSERWEGSRRYVEDTIVLETTFETAAGRARLIDCFPMRKGGAQEPYEQILRVVEGIEGRVRFVLQIAPRFMYGAVRPWIRLVNDTHYVAIGGSDGLLFSGDFNFQMKRRHNLSGYCEVEKGQRRYLSILYRRPELLDREDVRVPTIQELDERIEETILWWKRWASQVSSVQAYPVQVLRSALVLKGLSNAPTGAIAAAATTSLPESPGGTRNWDYRFTWIRDSSFSVRSLAVLGYVNEADGFRRFVERSAAGSAGEMQVLFGVGGERHLLEWEVAELAGYRGAKPVRVGNAAEGQKQFDIYGELLDLAWRWHEQGHSPDDDYWEFIVELVNAAGRVWRDPDRGMWEMRGKRRHFVHSKVMCWLALDRGIRLAADLGRKAPVKRWIKERDEVCRTVEEKGYDKGRGVFIQAFDHPRMDAALLLLPVVGFVDFCDERMIRTTNAVRHDLDDNGLLLRYERGDDGMKGHEGVFLACSFWLVECLARQGCFKEAHELFSRIIATGNDLGLFSEEYDTKTGEMLGNFPQGLTHLSLISAAITLKHAKDGASESVSIEEA